MKKNTLRDLKKRLRDWLLKHPEPSDTGTGLARKAAEAIKKRKEETEKIK